MYDVRGRFRWAVSISLFGALLLNGCVALPVGFFSKSAVFAERQGGLGPGETITKTITYHRKWVPFDFEHSWIHDDPAKATYTLENASGRKTRLDFLTVHAKEGELDEWQFFLPVEGGAKWLGFRFPELLCGDGAEFIVFDNKREFSRRQVSYHLHDLESSPPLIGEDNKGYDGNRFYEFDTRPVGSIETVRYRYNVLEDKLDIMPEALRRYEALMAMPMRMEGHTRATRYVEREQYNQAKTIAGVEFDPKTLDYCSVMATNKYNEWNAFLKVRMPLHGADEADGFEGFIKKGVQLPKEKWSSRLMDHARWAPNKTRPWWDPSTNDVSGMTFGQELGVDGVCYSKYEKGYLYYEAHVKKWQ